MRLVERMRRLPSWLWLREGEVLRWIGVGIWLGLVERIALTTDLTFPGAVDDLALCALLAVVVAPLRRVPRGLRVGVLSVLSLLLVVVAFGDAVHYRYFGAFLNVEDVLLAQEVPAISRSIADLLTPSVIAVGLVVPLGLVAWSLRASFAYGARRGGSAARIALSAAALLSASSAAAVGHTSAAHNNPVMLALRQGVGVAFGPVGGDGVIAELAQGLPAFPSWGPGYEERFDPEHPLLRRPPRESGPTRPLNVVIVLMESVRAYETGLGIAGVPSVTPNLNRLRREALWFPHHYAVGHQTVRGEGAVLCSVLPNYGGAPTYVRYPSVRLRCLPEILRDHGYSTHWISGFKSSYFNKHEFLTAHGVSRIDDMRAVARSSMKHPKLGWGPSDEDIFAHAVRVLDGAKKPFFAEIMTLSNHHPFDHGYGLRLPGDAERVRENRLYRAYQRGVHYTDYAIGTFFDAVRKRPWYRDTVFVITGDHGARAFPNRVDPDEDDAVATEMFFRSPLLILAPERKERRIDVVGSQVDVAPTLLEMLGVHASNAFMGVSLLGEAKPHERYAIMAEADSWNIRRGDEYCYSLAHSCSDGGVPPCGPSLRPVVQERTCFEVDGDLLDPGASKRSHVLDPAEAAPLRALGERVVRATRSLLALDEVYPRDQTAE